MRESSTIQAFIEEGRRKGLEEGLEEGRAGEARKIILRQGRIRFGEAGDAVRSRLRPPDLPDFDVGPSWAFRAHRRSSRRVADW